MKTIFLDRDGTINRESGYINHFSMFEFLPGTIKALKLLKENGWQLILITNQAGIARGYFSEVFLVDIHQQMQTILKKGGAELDAIYYCPHHPDVGEFPYKKNCDCRKPKTGLIEKALKDFPVDMQGSYMVGDRYNDIRMGKKMGLSTAFLLSGYGRGEWEADNSKWDEKPDHVFEDLYGFASWLVKAENKEIL